MEKKQLLRVGRGRTEVELRPASEDPGYDPRAFAPRDHSSSIAAATIGNDDLDIGVRSNRIEAATDRGFFVEGRDDDRELQLLNSSTTTSTDFSAG